MGAFDALTANRKLSRDVGWTLGSFVVLTISGLAINVIVAVVRGAEDLGVFNLSYAVYIVASQLAALGIHYSVMRSAARLQADAVERAAMLRCAALLAAALGITVALLVVAGRPVFEFVFGSRQSADAVAAAGVGLALFPLNKVLIAHINGLRHMRMFATLQATRYVLVAAWVCLIAFSDRGFVAASYAFIVAESLTTAAALLYLWQLGELRGPDWGRRWVKQHFDFGLRSLPSGALLEFNSRVDVLLIGVLLSERAVGIYSFASMLYDGIYHVIAMLRVNITPMLVAAHHDGDWAECQRLLGVSRRFVMPGVALLSLVTVAGYLVAVEFFVAGKGFDEGLVPLLVLLGGITLASPLLPFDNLMLAAGFPIRQSLQNFVLVTASILVGLALIPVLGIVGAALGVASGTLCAMAILTIFGRRHVGWDMLRNCRIWNGHA